MTNSKCVAMIIQNKIPIEWMKFNMYIEEDIYRNIPMLVFRVDEICPENLIEKLKGCVEHFSGILDWKIFKDPLSRRGNYLLTISELEIMHEAYNKGEIEYDQKKYFGIEKYKKYCECAIKDIPLLAKHIDENFKIY